MTDKSPLYDIVIIGSGLGGLFCGALLTKAGKKVLILEKNRQYGGALQMFSRHKKIVDSGVHYLGSVEPGQVLERLFSYLNIYSKLEFTELDKSGFDRIYLHSDNREYPHARGKEGFKDGLIPFFPDHEKQIINYLEAIKASCENFPLYHLKSSGEFMGVADESCLSVNAYDEIHRLAEDPHLAAVLSGNHMLHAGYKESLPFYVHSFITQSYLDGAYTIRRGAWTLRDALQQMIREGGGQLLNYKEVKKIHTDQGKVSFVECEDATVYSGEKYISAIHPHIMNTLLDRPAYKKAAINRINSQISSISFCSVYLFFKAGRVPFFNYNQYRFLVDDPWDAVDLKQHSWPTALGVFPIKDVHRPSYLAGLSVMTYMDFESVKPWENSVRIIPQKAEIRGSDYENFKRECAETLMDKLEYLYPGIRENVEGYEVATPLTFRDYLNSPEGSIYGVQADSRNPLRNFYSPKTPLTNLFQAGQNIKLHGILGVAISAILTGMKVLDDPDLIEKIARN